MSTNTNEYVNLLKKELSLVDDEIYIKQKEQAVTDLHNKIKEVFDKPLDQFVIDDDDLDIFAQIAHNLPDDFFRDISLDKSMFITKQWHDLEEYHELVPAFLRKLSYSNITSKIEILYSQKEAVVNEPIDTLLDKIEHGNEEEKAYAKSAIESRFSAQDHDCQIKIMKTLLNAKHFNKTWCFKTLLYNWWDDALSIDIENICRWDRKYRYDDSDLLLISGIIARRFPMNYVMFKWEIHEEFMDDDDDIKNYYEFCRRLAKVDSFKIDTTKLSRLDYLSIMFHNNIQLDDEEADDILFGHILKYLSDGYRPRYHQLHEYFHESCFDKMDLYSNYQYFHKLLIDYKPSLWFIPNINFYVNTLGRTNNVNTVVKFLLWNKRLKECIPGFLSSDVTESVHIEHPIERFKAYHDWSWDLFVKLALETCPVSKDKLTLVFGLDDKESAFC